MLLGIVRRALAGGRLFTWGEFGKGLGYATSPGMSYTVPRAVDVGEKVVQADLGNHHSALVTESGRLFVWGENRHGSLGLNRKGFSPETPTEL
jgi:alpha-tubulin suppressor-like RCC1 family protein